MTRRNYILCFAFVLTMVVALCFFLYNSGTEDLASFFLSTTIIGPRESVEAQGGSSNKFQINNIEPKSEDRVEPSALLSANVNPTEDARGSSDRKPRPSGNLGPLLTFVWEKAKIYRGTIIVAFTDRAMKLMTINWLLSLHRAGFDIKIPLIACFDESIYLFFKERNLSVFLLTPDAWTEIGWPAVPAREGTDVVKFYSSEYLRLVQSKIVVVRYLIRNGYSVFFQDVDTVLIHRDPHGIDRAIDLLQMAPSNISVVMTLNRENFFEYNTGYYVARPSSRVLQLLDDTIEHMKGRSEDDQTVFNEEVVKPQHQGVVSALPDQQFMCGKLTFKQPLQGSEWESYVKNGWNEPTQNQYPFMMHANWVTGDEKAAKLKEWRLWFADDEELLRQTGLNS